MTSVGASRIDRQRVALDDSQAAARDADPLASRGHFGLRARNAHPGRPTRPATARMVPTRQTQRGTDDVQDSGMVSRKPGRVDYRRSQLRSGRREPNSYHQFGRSWTRHGSGYPYSESPAVRRWWRSRHVPTGHESGSAVLRSNGARDARVAQCVHGPHRTRAITSLWFLVVGLQEKAPRLALNVSTSIQGRSLQTKSDLWRVCVSKHNSGRRPTTPHLIESPNSSRKAGDAFPDLLS